MDVEMHFSSSVKVNMFLDLQLPPWGPFGIFPQSPKNSVTVNLEGGEVHFCMLVMPHVWHSITVKPTRGHVRSEKAYKYKDGFGQEWWSSYVRFVNLGVSQHLLYFHPGTAISWRPLWIKSRATYQRYGSQRMNPSLNWSGSNKFTRP